jgi:hypothetical protein
MRLKTFSPQANSAPNSDFQRLIATFQWIAAINDPIERDFELGRSARDHGLPRQEIRRFYREWALTQRGGQA